MSTPTYSSPGTKPSRSIMLPQPISSIIPFKPLRCSLRIFNSFLPAGGLILLTMGSSEWEGIEDFYGTKMYFSHYGPVKNKQIIERAGFEVILDEIDASKGEEHQVILARKM